MKLFEDKLRKALTREIQCTKQRINVVPHSGMFNLRCHENSIEFARQNPDHKVIETIYIDDQHYPTLHYINQAPDGTFIDTTLGYKAEYYEYFFLREIVKDDFKTMGWIFDNTVEFWSRKYMRSWHTLFGITRLL